MFFLSLAVFCHVKHFMTISCFYEETGTRVNGWGGNEKGAVEKKKKKERK